jgi:hypothetical protein
MNLSVAAIVSLVLWPALLTGCAADPNDANQTEGVVRNGSFESPSADAPYVRMAPALPLDGWTIGNAPIDLVGDYWRAADGAQSIHIARGATVSQELRTKPGRTYELRFAAAANADPDVSNPIKHLTITWGDKTIDTLALDSRMHSREEMGWRYYAYPVKATGSHTTLRFACEETNEWGVALDNVRLEPIAAKLATAR